MINKKQFVAVLGIAQDGGYPQAGCNKMCCRRAWKNPNLKKHVSCLAIVDNESNQCWLIDATPDFKEQMRMLKSMAPAAKLNGILLTHAHTGHYTGLINLGKEVMNTKYLPVYAAQRMKKFLTENLPWSRLIRCKNIKLIKLADLNPFYLSRRIKITPFIVPHRDEISETLGFKIEGRNKTVIYIPDIDSWKGFETRIMKMITSSNRIFIDGTFYDKDELGHRNIRKIPHPPISETIKILSKLPWKDKNKVHFLHLNHTNPVLKASSSKRVKVGSLGFRIAEELMKTEI